MILRGANVVLGVTGGIAAYKAVDLCSKMVQFGATVDVIMTETATRFVTPLPFQTIAKRPVSVDMFRLLDEADMAHIALSERADIIVIAPATANTIAKLAHGLADNLLACTVLAATAPLVVAPAMNADMWANPVTQRNANLLRQREAIIVGPSCGRLASGRTGIGRLATAEEILAAVRKTLGRDGPLASLRLTVTAGGTREPLDPVRHVGNRSSGRMGYALAEAARDYGAQVRLISAPTCLPSVYGVETVPIRTAAAMYQAVMDGLDSTDILIMSAAVADYRPARVAEQKIKKGDAALTLELERTKDILVAVAKAHCAGRPGLVVGFAAETEDLLANASRKLREKRLDLIAANDVSSTDSGFGVETIRITLLTPDGQVEALQLMPKFEAAERILDRVARMWEASHG